jgi:glycerophosphoryl diester phosphodiesterase/HEAT repeat protein/MFS family permease
MLGLPKSGSGIQKAASFWRNPAAWIRQQKLSRRFWVFFTAAFFFDAGFAVYFFLFNLYLLDNHFTDRAIGLIGGAMTLGTLAGTLPAGVLARKFGVRPLLVFCFLAAPLTGILRAVWMWEPAQIGLAFLAGIAICGWGVCYLPAVARLTTEENRTSAFSLIFSVSIGTSMLGGIVCGYLPQWLRMIGIAMQASEVKRAILLVSCGIALIGLFPALRLQLPSQSDEQSEPLDTSALKHRIRSADYRAFLIRYLPLMALWSAVLLSFTPFANVYLSRDLHIPMARIGLTFSAVQVLQLCMGLLTPIVFRLLGLVNGIVATQLVAAVSLASMAGSRHASAAIPLYLTFSAAQWMGSPGLYNLLMNETPDNDRSTAAAMTLFCNALAGSAATAGAGMLFTRFGYPPVLFGIATVAATVAILFLVLIPRRKSYAPLSVPAADATFEPGQSGSFDKMKQIVAVVLFIMAAATVAHAADPQPGRVALLCHRTANEDVPENTLESLEEAALLGCNVVEIDLRRTLDGKIVLNHDGVLERLTDGIGDVETSYYGDLRMRDAGAWMEERFQGMSIPLFEDALRLAREKDIRLILDVKDKGIGAEVLQLLQREGMLQRVNFGGEWADIKQLYPGANENAAVSVPPGVTAERVKALHGEGKAVIANFSANDHEMDLAAMKAAVAAGVDGINVDYPRLGADAVGRPVEQKLAALAMQANTGESGARARAILELSRYRGFYLEGEFAHWLLDTDDHVSRAAALALVTSRPPTPADVFAEALRSDNSHARANAAWALGVLHAPSDMLLPMLQDNNIQVLQETLVALSRMPGEVKAETLLPLLSHREPSVRGAAALALARHQPDIAATAVTEQLKSEVKAARILYDGWVQRGKGQLTQAQIDEVMGYYRCQMKEMQAISMLHSAMATQALEEQAFRPGEDFSQMNGVVAAFQMWDRLRSDPNLAVQALGAADPKVADKAEWMLVQAGPSVLPAVRHVLDSQDSSIRKRAIQIVGWQGDAGALQSLRTMQRTGKDVELTGWAIDNIEALHPKLGPS